MNSPESIETTIIHDNNKWYCPMLCRHYPRRLRGCSGSGLGKNTSSLHIWL